MTMAEADHGNNDQPSLAMGNMSLGPPHSESSSDLVAETLPNLRRTSSRRRSQEVLKDVRETKSNSVRSSRACFLLLLTHLDSA